MKTLTKASRISWETRLPGYHPIARELNRAGIERKRLIELALKEAEALAWQSGVPDLVFVSLAEEKVAALEAWTVRQEAVLRRGWEQALSA